MSTADTLKREMRVAFSPRAQPVWFRVVKWVVLIGAVIRFWRYAYFWWVLLGAFAVSLTLHVVWRWKTKGWTQPWGGWSDIEAGRPKR